MSQAAKLGDRIVAVDTHITLAPSPAGPVATPTPTPFDGPLVENLCATVMVDNMPVATDGSVALNRVPHAPTPGPFQHPPKNRATVKVASCTVFAAGKRVAKATDPAETCNDPEDAPHGAIIADSTVKVG